MTVNLPEDLERFIQAEVSRGHFASEQDALAEAVRLLRRQASQKANLALAPSGASVVKMPDPILGSMEDAADELDEIVAAAMKHREQQPWRQSSSE